MADLRQSALSKQYVCVPVAASASGSAVDPTDDTVTMAFPATGVGPVSGDWKTASWEDLGGSYLAKCLVGPSGTVTLTAATYDVWVKVTDSTEVPAEKVGTLEIF